MMWRLQTVRVRATAGATVIVAIALLVAGVLLVEILHRSQLDVVDKNLELRSLDIEGLIDGGAALSSIAVQSDEDGFVQIIDRAGAVVAASGNIAGETPIIDRPPGWVGTARVDGFGSDEIRVGVFDTDGAVARIIVVGTSLEDVEHTVDVVTGALLVGLPVLLLLIAALVWIIVGRALDPVERMRQEVDDIGGGDLHRRVRDPATHDEIGRLASTMNAMLDRLESANLAQSRFVSDASHELRTPIAVIRHELEVALRADDESDWKRTAEEVLDEDLRMQRLVDDLLFLARRDGNAEPNPLAHELVDLDDVVIGEAHRVHSGKRVVTAGVSAGQVRGDADQLGRVVRNLIDNALRHSSADVALSVTSADGWVLLHVDDDGDGVDAADGELIFERFGRADEARGRSDGGSGLGLAIARDLVEDHGGTIAVSPSPTLGGARFTVSLPDARR